MEESAKTRFLAFLKKKGIGQTKCEEMCGISRGYLSKIKDNFGTDMLNKISTAFPQLNIKWIISGIGDMEYNDEPRISYTNGVPYYNVDFIGGFDLILNDQTTIPEYKIDFKKYNSADCWCNVTGHSMEPEISPGDIIALKELHDWRIYIPSGEIYGIVTTEHRTIKKVTPSNKEGFITLIPSNQSPEFVPQDIPISIIRKVYKVLGCMKRL